MKRFKSILTVLTVCSTVSAQVASYSEGDFSVGKDDVTTTTGFGSKLYFKGINAASSIDDVWIGRYQQSTDHTDLRIHLGDNIAGDDRLMIGSEYYVDQTYHVAMSIYNDGKVGINTENPEQKLHVNGNIKGDILYSSKIECSGKVFCDEVVLYTKLYTEGEIMGGSLMGNNLTIWGNMQGSNLNISGKIEATQLDLNGTIKAKEIIVTNTGWADFVFDKDYQLPSLYEIEDHIRQHQTLPGIPSESEVSEKGVDLAEMNAKLLQKVEELTLYIIQQQKEIDTLKTLIK